MKGRTYITKTGRLVGIRRAIAKDLWIAVYLDRDQHKSGRVRCTQVPVSADMIDAQANLDAHAWGHGWKYAGMQEIEK